MMCSLTSWWLIDIDITFMAGSGSTIDLFSHSPFLIVNIKHMYLCGMYNKVFLMIGKKHIGSYGTTSIEITNPKSINYDFVFMLYIYYIYIFIKCYN